MKTASGSVDVRFWIGLMKTPVSEWKWSLGDPAFYTANSSQYRSWGQNEPNSSLHECAYMHLDGLWRNDDCQAQRFFVCYNGSSQGLFLVQQPMSWRSAQSFCRANHTDLSSVRSQTENQQIQQLLNSTGALTSAWIGLFRDSWQWSNKSPSSFRNWGLSEPNGDSENGTVTVIGGSRNRQWEDWPCSSTFYFICQEDRFVLIKQNLSWLDAMAYCRQRHVDLVSVLTPQVEQRVMKAARRASSAAVWMGLHHYCSMNMWLWLQGEVLCYQNWAKGNGAEPLDCSRERRVGAIQSSGDQRWVSLPPTLTLNFICSN